jgi:sugar lactone lactonase YvrE
MANRTRVLTDGIFFGEAPRWHQGRLWFSDFHAHAVLSVSLAGDLRTEFEIDDQPSGLGWMPDGSLLVVSMRKRQILRRFADNHMALHADLGGVATFHCNDMVVDAAGRAYVGNFGFDLDAEIASRGVQSVVADHARADLALVRPDGSVEIAARGLSFPNGSVITPDGRTLIVGETLAGALTAFDIAEDGTLSRRRVWANIAPRIPDGCAMDADGAMWVANAVARECVLVTAGGEIRDVVATDEFCFACMLGGDDGRTLFMMTAPTSAHAVASQAARGKILVAEVAVPHAGRP